MRMPTGTGPRQLALALKHSESFAREDFLSGTSNEAALALIERWPDWPDRVLALIGPEGSGKSHLAAIWAAEAGARMLASRALATANLPAALATGALVVEDASEVTSDPRQLLHLLNLAREDKAYVLMTARAAPASWRVAIPDLASRLRALPAITIAPPDDALMRALLIKLFADRQLAVDDSLVGYLVSRIERSFAGVRAAVEQLDREALRQQRPVTRSLAAELFREN
jgi:chromosomal replication initiation ATPase DnaA